MSIELDHFFILTDPNAPAADLLVDIGLTEGAANDHPGQGTSNRRFFFTNSMLELMYVRDAQEAMNGSGYRLRLSERISDPVASPFGLVFSATGNSTSESFPGWKYSPEYLPEGQYFRVGENSNQIDEPLCIQLPQTFSRPLRQPVNGQFDCVTGLRVCFPGSRISPALAYLKQCEMLSLVPGQAHLMEIVFNENRAQQSRDLRPLLPLIVRW